MRLKLLLYLSCYFSFVSCDNYSQSLNLPDFDFYISSFDNSGLIQLPDIIENKEVIDILIINKPKGLYEVSQIDCEASADMNYVYYQALSDTLSFDQIHFRLLTEGGRSAEVTANLSPIRDSNCQGSDPAKDYNFLLQNHKLSLSAGKQFKIQLDGLVANSKASASLLPGCDIIQDYGFRTTLLMQLGKHKVFQSTIPYSDNYASFSPDSKIDGIRFSHETKDGPLFISGVIPADAVPGIYKVVYGVLVHKLKDGLFLSNFKLYPEATWEWPEQLTVHKYGVISFEITTAT